MRRRAREATRGSAGRRATRPRRSAPGSLGGSRGRRALVVVELDDLALGHVLGDRLQTSISRTAPIAKFGATKQSASDPSAAARRRRGREPVVPTTVSTPASKHSLTLARAVSGTVKSTTTSASGAPRRARSQGRIGAPAQLQAVGLLDRFADGRARFAGGTGDRDPGNTATRASLTGATRLEAVFIGADAGGGEAVGGVELHRQLGQIVDRSRRLWPASGRGSIGSPDKVAARDPGHPRRRRLRGEDEAALDALLRPHQLLVRDRLGAQARQSRCR